MPASLRKVTRRPLKSALEQAKGKTDSGSIRSAIEDSSEIKDSVRNVLCDAVRDWCDNPSNWHEPWRDDPRHPEAVRIVPHDSLRKRFDFGLSLFRDSSTNGTDSFEVVRVECLEGSS